MADRVRRRLAAILAADLAGYSRLMGDDEEGTLAALTAHRKELVEPCIAEHRGRIVKTTGDGLLAEFASVVDAVRCAVAFQEGMAARNADTPADRRIEFRIGVNLGDVIVQDDDLYGGGVNVAARLEALAEPGGVVVSGKVHDEVRTRLDLGFDDLGPQAVKNIAEPIPAYPIKSATSRREQESSSSLPLPDKPSIAVLAFENMSGDPEQEYFADGIAEDVITALSRFRSLFVIARNSSFTYKGRAVDIAQVARELGVRYVVEGSVRKADERVRITAQLIDAASGNHLWAERFDGRLDDVFDLQDRITGCIVAAVEPEIQARERVRAQRKPPESLDAWELVQRGLFHFYRMTPTDHTEAMRLFRDAIDVDPEFAQAHAHLSYAMWTVTVRMSESDETAETLAAARAAAERALALDPNDPLAHFALGRLLIHTREPELAVDEMRTAIELNPNFAHGHYGLGMAYSLGMDQPELALPHLDVALRLSPRDPLRWLPLMTKGSALRSLDRYDEAIACCRQACLMPDTGFLPHLHLVAALADAGREDEARKAVATAMRIQPALSIGFVRDRLVGRTAASLNRFLDSLRRAGLPE